MSDICINGRTYSLNNAIGEGCTSTVYRATHQNRSYCLKVIKPSFYSTAQGQRLIDNEIQVLGEMKHEKLLRVEQAGTWNGKKVIVTELCPDGTLFDKVRHHGKLSEAETLKVMKDLVQGCRYMHQKGVLHRDLKPENIFIKNGGYKIADFGFAVHKSNQKLLRSNVGSPLYMPLEALSDLKFSQKSDIFALGVMWFEMLTGKTPFEGASEAQLKEKMIKGVIRKCKLSCNNAVKDIIMKCLNKDAHLRPDLNQMASVIKGETVHEENLSLKSLGKTSCCSGKTEKENDVMPTLKTQSQNRPRTKKELQPKEENMNVSATFKVLKAPLPLNQVKKTQSCKTEAVSKQPIQQVLTRLQGTLMDFLPKATQNKFSEFSTHYSSVLSGKVSSGSTEPTSELHSCRSESQLCQYGTGFVRQLHRLARSYKQHADIAGDLGKLWEHMDKVASACA